MRKRAFLKSFTLAASGLFVPRIMAADRLRERRVGNQPIRIKVGGGSGFVQNLGSSETGSTTYGSSAYYGAAASFVADWTGTLTKISVKIKKNSTPTSNVSASLFSFNADFPDVELCSSLESLAAADITTAYVWYDFTFVSGNRNIVNGTNYYITLWADALAPGAESYSFPYNNTGTCLIKRSSGNKATPNWSSSPDSSATATAIVYGV